MIKLLFLLLCGHSLADAALQPQGMIVGKRRSNPIDMSKVPKGQTPLRLWWMWLTHHSLIHGGVVCLLTNNVYLGIVETITHWIIDFFKSEGKYSPYEDQALHIGMKIIYCLILVNIT